jgi:tRNA A-37 threonylcarbamoyl transferase component Bud32
MKIIEHVIVKGKFMNIYKHLVGGENMKNIIENNVMGAGGNNRGTNTRNLHTRPINHMDLISVIVCIMHGGFIKFTNNCCCSGTHSSSEQYQHVLAV